MEFRSSEDSLGLKDGFYSRVKIAVRVQGWVEFRGDKGF